MNPLTKKAKSAIDRLTAGFDSPEKLIDTLSKATLIPNNSPCVNWGPYNRILVALRGTSDARGYRQWQEVSRQVKKGVRAIYILVPRFKKPKDDEENEDNQVLIGFMAAPVFAAEDTEGEPLPETIPKQMPNLQVVADALNLPVSYTGAVSEQIYGVYGHEQGDKTGKSGKITLYSHDLQVFYHELVHALHHRTGKIRERKSSSNVMANEIVAEIGAAVLVNIFEGVEMGHQAISYIKGYGAKKKHLLQLLPEIMEITELAINIVQETKQN